MRERSECADATGLSICPSPSIPLPWGEGSSIRSFIVRSENLRFRGRRFHAMALLLSKEWVVGPFFDHGRERAVAGAEEGFGGEGKDLVADFLLKEFPG